MIINSHAQLSNLVEVKKRIQEKYEVFALKKYLIDRALLSWVVDLSFVISIANINVRFVGNTRTYINTNSILHTQTRIHPHNYAH